MTTELLLGVYGMLLELPLGSLKTRELKQASLWELELRKDGHPSELCVRVTVFGSN